MPFLFASGLIVPNRWDERWKEGKNRVGCLLYKQNLYFDIIIHKQQINLSILRTDKMLLHRITIPSIGASDTQKHATWSRLSDQTSLFRETIKRHEIHIVFLYTLLHVKITGDNKSPTTCFLFLDRLLLPHRPSFGRRRSIAASIAQV